MKAFLLRIKDYLKGKKTYLGIIAGSIYAMAVIAGLTESNEMVWVLIGTWSGISFRAAL